MLLETIFILAVIQVTEQECNSHCLNCTTENLNDCARCNNNCFVSLCLGPSDTCGHMGCRSGWYGSRCDRRCSECPRGRCDHNKEACEGDDSDIDTMVLALVGSGLCLLIVISLCFYIYTNHRSLCKRKVQNRNIQLVRFSFRRSTEDDSISFLNDAGENYATDSIDLQIPNSSILQSREDNAAILQTND